MTEVVECPRAARLHAPLRYCPDCPEGDECELLKAEPATGVAKSLDAPGFFFGMGEGEFEDFLTDAIGDSLEMDWIARDGARAIIKALNRRGRT